MNFKCLICIQPSYVAVCSQKGPIIIMTKFILVHFNMKQKWYYKVNIFCVISLKLSQYWLSSIRYIKHNLYSMVFHSNKIKEIYQYENFDYVHYLQCPFVSMYNNLHIDQHFWNAGIEKEEKIILYTFAFQN